MLHVAYESLVVVSRLPAATLSRYNLHNHRYPRGEIWLKTSVLSSWEDRKKHSENEQQHHTQHTYNTTKTQLEHHKTHKLMHTNLIYQCILI